MRQIHQTSDVVLDNNFAAGTQLGEEMEILPQGVAYIREDKKKMVETMIYMNRINIVYSMVVANR